MKIMVRLLALMVILAFAGCATEGGGAAGTTGSETVKKLTDEDYNRIGVKEVYEKRQ